MKLLSEAICCKEPRTSDTFLQLLTSALLSDATKAEVKCPELGRRHTECKKTTFRVFFFQRGWIIYLPNFSKMYLTLLQYDSCSMLISNRVFFFHLFICNDVGQVSYFHHFLSSLSCIALFISPVFCSLSFFSISPLVSFYFSGLAVCNTLPWKVPFPGLFLTYILTLSFVIF